MPRSGTVVGAELWRRRTGFGKRFLARQHRLSPGLLVAKDPKDRGIGAAGGGAGGQATKASLGSGTMPSAKQTSRVKNGRFNV